MLVRRITTLLLLLFSARSPCFPQEFLSGKELSDEADRILSKNGFSCLRQELSQTGQDEFAGNLILTFPANSDGGSGDGQERDELIFCISQEDFIANAAEIIDFLSFLRDLRRQWRATALLAALDNPEFKDSRPAARGSLVFAESVEDADSVAAIIVGLDPDSATAVHTGGRNHTSPLWLTKIVTDAFFDSGAGFSFEDLISSVYRLGIVHGKERLSFFFENDIPAIEINLSEISGLSVLKNLARDYAGARAGEWDMHYLYIDLGKFIRAAFISERTLVSLCLLVGFLTILILCAFSFIEKDGESHKRHFIKSIHMIPLIIAVSCISLFLGQTLAARLPPELPVGAAARYGIKLALPMIFVSVIFIIMEIMRIRPRASVYGYLLSSSAILNIFLFSATDITLFVIFVIEYIIIFLSRKARNIPQLIFYLILIPMPFLPYGYIIIRKADDIETARAVLAGVTGNVLLASALFPFQVTWLRILALAGKGHGNEKRPAGKIILAVSVKTAALIAFILASILSISGPAYRHRTMGSGRLERTVTDEDRGSLAVRASKNEFSGMDTRHIIISSDEAAVRYEALLRGTGGSRPLYESVYDHSVIAGDDGEEVYSFIIPDYPPRQITIDYACGSGAEATIEVSAYYRTDKDKSFRRERRELKVD